MLALKFIPLLIVGLCNCLLGLFVLARGIHKLNRVAFFLLSFSVGGWAIGIASFLRTSDPNSAFLWAKLFYSFPLLISFSVVWFAFSFPTGTVRNVPKFWQAFSFFGFVGNFLPLITSKTYLTERLLYHGWGKEVILNKPEYLIYSFYLIVSFVTALFMMYRYTQKLKGIYGEQARLFFLGFSIASLFGVTFNLVFPGLGNYRLIWLGPLFTGVLIAALAVSITRHKMFDLRLVVARSLAYVATMLTLAVFYGLFVFGITRLIFHLYLPFSVQVFLSVATGIASLGFHSFKKNFDMATNRIFYQDAYDSQAFFDTLNSVLVSTVSLDKLLEHASSTVTTYLKASFCVVGTKDSKGLQRAIGVGGKEFSVEDGVMLQHLMANSRQAVILADDIPVEHKEMQRLFARNNISVFVRLTTDYHKNNEDLGYIALGQKQSGNLYSKQDVAVLQAAANGLIVAVQNALRFQEIQNFNQTLQQRVTDATKELKRTNEKLKTLDETKDDFISMASHQLRTPLTSVKGYVSLVLDGDAGSIKPEQRQLLNQAFASSQRMVYLISDLLNLSRLKTGKFIIEATPINLADVIASEVAQLQETAASRSLKLEYAKPHNFPQLMLDETKMRQVIMNFMDNAIYYTPSGGIIRVELADTGPTITLRVTDTGIGVPKSEQHHLFTKFYRAGNARKARPDGTGLGLFMAKKVVIAHGGSVIFETKEGKGSTFGFVFSKAKLAPPAHDSLKT